MHVLLRRYYGIVIIAILLLFKAQSISAQTEYLVTVDPSNAAITKIDSIPGVTWLKGFYIPTYCEKSKRYTFVGGDDPNGNPFYLFTIDAVSGKTISSPPFPDHLSFLALQYSGSGNTLYGITYPGISLVSINITTGGYSTVHNIPGLASMSKFMVDDLHNRFIIIGPDNIGNLMFLMMDISNGNIISQVHLSKVNNIVYNKLTDKFYAISNRIAAFPGPVIYSISTLNPVTGITTNIADIPNLAGFAPGNETLNENGNLYYFTGFEWGIGGNYLYTIDLNSGNIIHKKQIPMDNVINRDNLIQFRYDNDSKKLYALFWEALTVNTPGPIPGAIDSSCNLKNKTKVYLSQFGESLVVQKKPTICNVRMNLYNEIGQVMIKGKVINNGRNEIPLQHLATGIYFYKFYSDANTVFTGRILKQ